MGAFGDKLRREREMRGITLAEIAESTKISQRCLKALEEEQFEVLPGGVFNRGFVRAYARFLGINEEQTVADYIAASNEQEPPADKFPLEIHEKENNSPPLNPRRSIVPVMFALVALILVVGGWTFWMKHKPSGETSDRHASSPATQQTSSPSQAAPTSTPSPASTSSSQPAKAAESQSPDADKPGSSESQDQGGSISVVIRAKQDSWVSIVADGQVQWEGTLNANTERTIQAGKELVLKTGNAAGIEVSYNGKPLGALGTKEKEVRTITFNTAGLQQ